MNCSVFKIKINTSHSENAIGIDNKCKYTDSAIVSCTGADRPVGQCMFGVFATLPWGKGKAFSLPRVLWQQLQWDYPVPHCLWGWCTINQPLCATQEMGLGHNLTSHSPPTSPGSGKEFKIYPSHHPMWVVSQDMSPQDMSASQSRESLPIFFSFFD